MPTKISNPHQITKLNAIIGYRYRDLLHSVILTQGCCLSNISFYFKNNCYQFWIEEQMQAISVFCRRFLPNTHVGYLLSFLVVCIDENCFLSNLRLFA